jgi:uncharacterized lipoprotein
MTLRPVTPRALVAIALAAVLLSSAGCGWFRGKERYLEATESRPLELPPGLDRPAVDPAMAVPTVSAVAPATAPSAAPAAAASLTLDDTAENAFRRVGLALGRIDGVTVGGNSPLLGTYEVQYRGQDFLVRVQANGQQANVAALSPDGATLTSGAAVELIGLLRARLG